GGWSCRRERLLPELAQGVVAALEEPARDRQAGAVAAEPLGSLGVVGAVGALRPARDLGGLVQRPAKRRRTLPGEVAGRAALVGGMDGVVQDGVANRLPGGVKAGAVAQ